MVSSRRLSAISEMKLILRAQVWSAGKDGLVIALTSVGSGCWQDPVPWRHLKGRSLRPWLCLTGDVRDCW